MKKVTRSKFDAVKEMIKKGHAEKFIIYKSGLSDRTYRRIKNAPTFEEYIKMAKYKPEPTAKDERELEKALRELQKRRTDSTLLAKYESLLTEYLVKETEAKTYKTALICTIAGWAICICAAIITGLFIRARL